jgi:hypothetical protein
VKRADAALTADVPKWTSACKLSNCAYLYVKLKYDRNAFSGSPTNHRRRAWAGLCTTRATARPGTPTIRHSSSGTT